MYKLYSITHNYIYPQSLYKYFPNGCQIRMNDTNYGNYGQLDAYFYTDSSRVPKNYLNIFKYIIITYILLDISVIFSVEFLIGHV